MLLLHNIMHDTRLTCVTKGVVHRCITQLILFLSKNLSILFQNLSVTKPNLQQCHTKQRHWELFYRHPSLNSRLLKLSDPLLSTTLSRTSKSDTNISFPKQNRFVLRNICLGPLNSRLQVSTRRLFPLNTIGRDWPSGALSSCHFIKVYRRKRTQWLV